MQNNIDCYSIQLHDNRERAVTLSYNFYKIELSLVLQSLATPEKLSERIYTVSTIWKPYLTERKFTYKLPQARHNKINFICKIT